MTFFGLELMASKLSMAKKTMSIPPTWKFCLFHSKRCWTALGSCGQCCCVNSTSYKNGGVEKRLQIISNGSQILSFPGRRSRPKKPLEEVDANENANTWDTFNPWRVEDWQQGWLPSYIMDVHQEYLKSQMFQVIQRYLCFIPSFRSCQLHLYKSPPKDLPRLQKCVASWAAHISMRLSLRSATKRTQVL